MVAGKKAPGRSEEKNRRSATTMHDKLDSLLEQMHALEKEGVRELQKKEQEFFYEVRQGKVRFTEAARARHKLLVKSSPVTSGTRPS